MLIKKRLKKIGIRNNIDPKLVLDIYDDIFKQVKKNINDPSLPKVLLHDLGTFDVSVKRLKYKLKDLEDNKPEFKELIEIYKNKINEEE